MNEKLLTMLLVGGTKDADKINQHLLTSKELCKLSDKQMAVAAICYGAAMSKLTDLAMEDYISLAAYAYDQIISTKPQETKDEQQQQLAEEPKEES